MSSEALSILIADDNVDTVESLAMLLEIEGHVVRTAFDGEAAFAEAERVRPQVLVLDIGMPRLDGIELARRLRATDWGRTMVLVAVTGWSRDEDRRATADAGFDHHLVKPFDAGQLAGALVAWVAEARAR